MTDIATADQDCWEWPGLLNNAGYGVISSSLVHRTVYELIFGPIPKGLHVDHLCRNRKCANPAHLEAVTPAENARRAPNFQSLKVVCVRGHDDFVPRATGGRRCLVCAKDRDRTRTRVRRRAA